MASKHEGRDVRKESYRPDSDSIQILGEPIKSNPGNWNERARYALAKRARSMEDLIDRQQADRTSLGVFKPKVVKDLVVTPDDPDWKSSFKTALRQARLWETRTESMDPPRKVPFKFHYRFECDDGRCSGHKMMIEDWEVGALFWKLVDQGKAGSGVFAWSCRNQLPQRPHVVCDFGFHRGRHPKAAMDSTEIVIGKMQRACRA